MSKTFTVTTDYHMHSTFSPDGDDSPRLMCQQALDLGLTAIAITEHAEWHPAAGFRGFDRIDDYFSAIDQCRTEFGPQGLRVYSGVELGNPHQFFDEALRLVETYPFDVVIASLHWLNDKNIHLAECFADRDPYDVYADYFRQLRRLAGDFRFDILGHFDRILWRSALLGMPFDPYRLERVIRAALASLVKYDRCLELNTRFLASPYNWNPALVTMLRWYWEAGGLQVVVNSDAHRRQKIGRNRDIARQILAQAGFTFPGAHFKIEMSLELDLSASLLFKPRS